VLKCALVVSSQTKSGALLAPGNGFKNDEVSPGLKMRMIEPCMTAQTQHLNRLDLEEQAPATHVNSLPDQGTGGLRIKPAEHGKKTASFEPNNLLPFQLLGTEASSSTESRGWGQVRVAKRQMSRGLHNHGCPWMD
jgi:hypothetical protein